MKERNDRNAGLITNLLRYCCVEVPCHVNSTGITPSFTDELPPQLAALNRSNISVQELAVKAILEEDRNAVFHAIAYDPLTAAVLSLEEIKQMVDEMLEAGRPWLPDAFK